MSRIRSLIVAAAIIAVSVGLAAFLVSLAPEPARTEPPPPVPFAQTGLVKAGAGPIPVFGAGTVRPSAEIAITPQVGGKVVWVHPGFRSGGRVEKAGRSSASRKRTTSTGCGKQRPISPPGGWLCFRKRNRLPSPAPSTSFTQAAWEIRHRPRQIP